MSACLTRLSGVAHVGGGVWRGCRHAGEAAKFGIFFDDTTYDYTQHLKIIGDHPSSVFVPAKEAPTGRKARPNVRTFLHWPRRR